MHAQLGSTLVVDSAIEEYCLLPKNPCIIFWIIVYLYCEALSNQLCSICLDLSKTYVSIHFRIHSATVFCHIINEHTSATGRHACSCHHATSSMFYKRYSVLWIMSGSSSSPNFPLSIILVQVDLSLIFPKNVVPEPSWLLHVVIGKFNSDLYVDQWFTPCEKSFYSVLWSLLFVGELEIDIPISSWVCFTSVDVVEEFFFIIRRMLRSSSTVVFHGGPGHYELLCSLVQSFFLSMYQTVDLATSNIYALFLKELFFFLSPRMVCFISSESSFDCMLCVLSINFWMQMPSLVSTPDILTV